MGQYCLGFVAVNLVGYPLFEREQLLWQKEVAVLSGCCMLKPHLCL